MTPPPGAPHRAPIGATPTVRRRLALQRPRPVLVRAYALLFSDGGTFGAPARRRAGRLVLRCLTPAVTVGTGALVVLGAFDAAAPGWPQTAATAALAAALGVAVWRRTARAVAGEAASSREQLELGALFVVAAHAMSQSASGGQADSPLQPLVYLVMAFLVAFMARRVGLTLVLAAVALELLVWHGRGAHAGELSAAIVRSGFVTLFAVLYHAVLAAPIGAARRAEERAVERRLKEIDERAREFRLTASGTTGAAAPDGDARWRAASVVEVEHAMRGALEVAEAALRSHTCAVYLLDDAGERLRLRECRSTSDAVAPELSAREGALGAAIARRTSVRLHGDVKVATYYEDGARPGALVVVPLIDRRGGHVRGVIVADRRDPAPFSDEDERLVQTLCAEIFRALEAERVMGDMKTTRDEKKRFYDAIELLNRTNKPDEVFRAIMKVAGERVPIDSAAVTLVELQGGRRVHRVAAVHGERWAAIAGRSFAGGDGFVQRVVELDTTLPAASVDLGRATLFDASTPLKGLGWVRILPLRAGGEVLGTVVLAGAARDRPPTPDHVRQLEVFAGQAAQSILRARLYEDAERLATTDGLTGLTNHRTFQTRLDEHLALAARREERLSLLLCDVDHFKSVNDTYGHPVGDEVLRGVARVLAGEARQTDVVARYGGEEFAIVMPCTEGQGAAVIAERIRERIAATTFQTDQGPLRVTMSLGVATWPEDGAKKPELVERADACLYHAKRHGRNQTVLAATLRAPRRAAG